MRNLLLILILVSAGWLKAQRTDSTCIQVDVSEDLKTLRVHQKIFIFKNSTAIQNGSLRLGQWINSYRQRSTVLAQRLLEDRNKELYFADDSEIGHVSYQQFVLNGSAIQVNNNAENIFLSVQKGEDVHIDTYYVLQLPQDRFTGMGYREFHAFVKYFFLCPALETENFQTPEVLKHGEETRNPLLYWKIEWTLPKDYQVFSNLEQVSEFVFEGSPATEPEFILQEEAAYTVKLNANTSPEKILMAYPETEV